MFPERRNTMLHHVYLEALESIKSHEGECTPESDALVAAIVQYEEENNLIPPPVELLRQPQYDRVCGCGNDVGESDGCWVCGSVF